MKYISVCLAVKDIHKARAFYESVFDLKVESDYGINISFGEISLQQDFDWLIDVDKEQIKTKANNVELYFEEDDLDGFVEKLKLRDDIVYLHSGVKEPSWGQRLLRFYDLDFHLIEVGENLNAVIHRFLQEGMSLEQVAKRMDISLEDVQTIING